MTEPRLAVRLDRRLSSHTDALLKVGVVQRHLLLEAVAKVEPVEADTRSLRHAVPVDDRREDGLSQVR